MHLVWIFLLALLGSVACAHPAVDNASSDYDMSVLMAPEATGPIAEAIHEDFEFLRSRGAIPFDTLLKVKRHGELAVVLSHRVIVVAERLGQLSRNERLFVLAHEASHARHDDRDGQRQFMAEALPSFLRGWEIGSRYEELRPELRRRAHEQEFRADAEAFQALTVLGISPLGAARDLFGTFPPGDTDTHPSPARRLQRLIELRP